MEQNLLSSNPVTTDSILEPDLISSPSWKGPALIWLFCTIFIFLKIILGGLHVIHWEFVLAILGFYYLHPLSRKLVVIALPMAFYGLMYDFFRYIPFRLLLPIRIQELYHWDLSLFGVHLHGKLVLLNELLFKTFSSPWVDAFSGVVYLLHIPMIIFMVLMFWKYSSISTAQRFTLAFLAINLLAFATYFLFPAAAPWYVEKFGFLQPSGPIPGDPAGLARFDQLLGLNIFTGNYQISPVTLGAMPSMHAGFATLAWLYSFKFNKKLVAFLSLYIVSMYFSALYLQHHYLLDALIGSVYAVVVWLLLEKVFPDKVDGLNGALWRIFYLNSPGTIFRSR